MSVASLVSLLIGASPYVRGSRDHKPVYRESSLLKVVAAVCRVNTRARRGGDVRICSIPILTPSGYCLMDQCSLCASLL